MTLSHSRVNLLLNICPFQWGCRYERREDAISPPRDPSMEAGKAIHKVLEESMNCSRGFGFEPEKSNYAYFMQCAEEQCSEGARELLQSMHASAETVLHRIMARAKEWNAQVFTERQLLLDRQGRTMRSFTGWPNVGWVGYVDFELKTNNQLVILDYKSEHYSEEREESVKTQTEMYAYAEFLRYPMLKTVKTGCAYLKDGDIVMGETIKRDDLPEIERNLKELYQRYLDAVVHGSREPRQSKYCSWCGYTHLCPLQEKS